jgi:uncharacterized delta-60 repeat protein
MLSAGDLDTTFGRGGTVVTPVSGSDDVIYALDVLPDGKVLAAGRGNGDRFVVARYDADGLLDKTFGRGGADGDGVVTPDLDPQGGQASAIAQLPGGKFLVAGTAGGIRGMAVVRFNADGTPDPTFGGGDGIAVVTFRPGPAFSVAQAMVLQPDGRIVLGGAFTADPSGWEWALARLMPNGEPDASFGPDGTGLVVTSAPASDDSRSVRINALALAPGGRILAAGGTGRDLALLRYMPDGTLDPAFGRGGVDGDGVVVDDNGPDDVANDVAVLPDGKILIAGGSGLGPQGQGRAFVARYLPDGRRDLAFLGTGRYEIDGSAISGGASSARFTDLAIQPDGKIVAGGDFFNDWPNFNDMLLVRLSPDGQPDQSFRGVDSYFDVPPGAVNVMVGPLSQDTGEALALAPDGRILIGGYTFTTQGSPLLEFALSRVLNDVAGDGTRAYEAELATVSGPAVSAEFPGYGGSGFVDFLKNSGDAVEFAIDVPATGRYTLGFRYANGAAAARAVALSVGGAAVPGGVSFAPTGSWRAWKTVPVTLDLPAGPTTVRLRAAGQSGPNLDALTVRPLEQPSATYQAEGALLNGAVFADDARGFTGSGFADFRLGAGSNIEFKVNVPADGAYDLDVRYANGSGSDRPLRLDVDDQAVDTSAFTPTGAWRTWNTVTAPSVTLTAGRHTVRLTELGREGPNVDALTVRPRAAQPPPQPVTLQAEAATRSGAGFGAVNPGFHGQGYADYLHSSGDFVEFAYAAPAAGEYRLEFRYANGTASDRPLELRVNDAVLLPRLSFAPTGKWSAWATASATVPLAAGSNKIRLTTIGQNGANIDELTITPASART